MDERGIATDSSTYKKLAVQWLNQVQFFNQTFVQVDSFVGQQTVVLRKNICGKIRQYAKPQTVSGQYKTTLTDRKLKIKI